MRINALSILLAVTALSLAACIRQKVDLVAYETQVAEKIYTTQTAAMPTVTITLTPTITLTITPFPTLTPTPIPRGVIRSQVLNMREGPSTNYPVISGLNEGDLVYVMGQFDECNWLKIKTQPGPEGWVKGENTLIEVDTPCELIRHGSFRPINGELVLDKRSGAGLSQLKVQNGTETDGVVVIATETGSPVVAFYIHNQKEFTFSGVPDGIYQIYFMLGKDWDGDEKAFMQVVETKKMDMTLEFKTTASSFAVWTISLNPVPEGSGTTSEVPLTQFPILP